MQAIRIRHRKCFARRRSNHVAQPRRATDDHNSAGRDGAARSPQGSHSRALEDIGDRKNARPQARAYSRSHPVKLTISISPDLSADWPATRPCTKMPMGRRKLWRSSSPICFARSSTATAVSRRCGKPVRKAEPCARRIVPMLDRANTVIPLRGLHPKTRGRPHCQATQLHAKLARSQMPSIPVQTGV